MANDPLDEIFKRAEEIEGTRRALLARMVVPFATVEVESGRVYFKPEADKLTTKQKILVYLLARLALSQRSGDLAVAAVLPREIQDGTSLPGGTVRPQLQKLVQEHVVQNSDGRYSVQPGALERAHKQLAMLLTE